MKVGEIVNNSHLTYDGIVEEEKFVYLGDGIYAPIRPDHQPEVECGEEGESGNTDNNVLEWSQEDREGR